MTGATLDAERGSAQLADFVGAGTAAIGAGKPSKHEGTIIENRPEVGDPVVVAWLRHEPREATGASLITSSLRPYFAVYETALTDVRDVAHEVMSGGTPHTIITSVWRAGAAAVSAVAEAVRAPSTGTSPAYQAFKDLGRWLGVDDGQVADMLGIGRTTAYTWKREGREPRAQTTQRLYEYHATLDSVRRVLGLAGMRTWLHEAGSARLNTLLRGDLAMLDRDVHEIVFRPRPEHRVDLAAAPEPADETDDVLSHAGLGTPARPSGRRPRRRRPA